MKVPMINAAIPWQWNGKQGGNVLTDAAYRRGYLSGLAGEARNNPYLTINGRERPLRKSGRAWNAGYRDANDTTVPSAICPTCKVRGRKVVAYDIGDGLTRTRLARMCDRCLGTSEGEICD